MITNVEDKRFLAVWADGGMSLMTEREASFLVDTKDYYDPFYLYYNDLGKLVLVEFGPVHRTANQEESDIIYAFCEMRANGKTVGHVHFTDH